MSSHATTERPLAPFAPFATVALIATLALVGLGALTSPAVGQPRPVSLDRLSEREAITKIEQADPSDFFLVQGRRVRARDLQRRLTASREGRRAEIERIERLVRQQKHESISLALLRARAELDRERREREGRAALERAEPTQPQRENAEEIRTLQSEFGRLLETLRGTTDPQERAALERRARGISERLAALGVGRRGD